MIEAFYLKFLLSLIQSEIEPQRVRFASVHPRSSAHLMFGPFAPIHQRWVKRFVRFWQKVI